MIEVFKYKEINNNLIDEWKIIENDSFLTPFQSYEWINHYTNIILKDSNVETFFFVIKSNGIPTDIIPLCIKKQFIFKKLEWIGGLNTDFMGIISSKKSVFKDNKKNFFYVWTYIIENLPKIDLIFLEKNPIKFEKQYNFFIQNFKIKKSIINLTTILDSAWINKEFVNKRIINDNKRQRKRLSKLGNLKFFIADSKKEKLEIVNKMIQQKHLHYNQSGKSMFSLKKYKDLYLLCSDNLGKYGKVHISALLINDEIIATHWGFYNNETFYYIMPSYNINKWGVYSPGKILLEFLIDWSSNNNIKKFDFTEGDATYKRNWSNNIDYLYEITIVKSVKGFLLYSFYKMKFFLKKIYFIVFFYKFLKKLFRI